MCGATACRNCHSEEICDQPWASVPATDVVSVENRSSRAWILDELTPIQDPVNERELPEADGMSVFGDRQELDVVVEANRGSDSPGVLHPVHSPQRPIVGVRAGTEIVSTRDVGTLLSNAVLNIPICRTPVGVSSNCGERWMQSRNHGQQVVERLSSRWLRGT